MASKEDFLLEQARIAEKLWEQKNAADRRAQTQATHALPVTKPRPAPSKARHAQRNVVEASQHSSVQASQQSSLDIRQITPVTGDSEDGSNSDDESGNEEFADTPTTRGLPSRNGRYTPVQREPEDDLIELPSKKRFHCGYKDRRTLAARMKVDPDDAVKIRSVRNYLSALCERRRQPLDKSFERFDPIVMYKLTKIVSEEMREHYGKHWRSALTRDVIHAICIDRVRNDRARLRGAAKRRINIESVDRVKKTVRISAPDNEQRDEEVSGEEEPTPRAKAPGNLPRSGPLDLPMSTTPNAYSAPRHIYQPIVATPNHTKHPIFIDDLTPTVQSSVIEPVTPMQRLSIPSTPGLPPPSSSEIETPQSEYDVDEPNIFNQQLTIYISGHLPFKINLSTSFTAFDNLISRFLPLEENSVVLYRPAIGPKKGLVWRAMSGAAEYGRMMGVCAEGGVVVKLADAAWWDPEAPEQEELPVNPQIWRDQVLAGKNKKIRTISGVFEISKGQKKAAQQKSAKASTQVSSPHPDSQVIGYSNTQPIPGRSSAGHKRKANSPNTVSDKRGLELPGHGENVAETQIAASQLPESQFPESQLPESQFPESQLPEWQIPETQIIASQSPESQYPDSIPDSQAPQIEKKKRGRPKGSGKKKGVPPPTIGEEDTINPGTGTEGPRPKRTIKRTGKAAETAAIQAEKNAIEQLAAARKTIRERQADFNPLQNV